jgi:primosomal protein N' (replication factor Y)
MEERVYDQIAYNLRKNVPLIIQTFSPNTPLLKIIEGGNYKDFLTHTLTERKLFHYPPYTGLAYIWVEDKNKNRVQEIIHKLVNKLTLIKNENIILNYDKELYERRA